MRLFFRSAALYLLVFIVNDLAEVGRTEDERDHKTRASKTEDMMKRNSSSDDRRRKMGYLLMNYETIKAMAGSNGRKTAENNTQSSSGFVEKNEKSGFLDRKIHELEVNVKSTKAGLSQQRNQQQALDAVAKKISEVGGKKISEVGGKKIPEYEGKTISEYGGKTISEYGRKTMENILSERPKTGSLKNLWNRLLMMGERRIVDDYRPGTAGGISDNKYVGERGGTQGKLGYMLIARDTKGEHGMIGVHDMILGEIREHGKVGSHRVGRERQGGLRIEASTENSESQKDRSMEETEGIARMTRGGWRDRAVLEEINTKMRGKEDQHRILKEHDEGRKVFKKILQAPLKIGVKESERSGGTLTSKMMDKRGWK